MNHVQIAVSGIPLRASGMALRKRGDAREKKKRKNSTVVTAPIFLKFLKSAGAWKGNDGVGHDGTINI